MRKLIAVLRKDHPVFLAGAFFSFFLLVTLLAGQGFVPYILDLESRWLVVSGIPLLIALFVGGYITSFKGFGVELEARLRKSVDGVNLGAKQSAEAAKLTDGFEKASLAALDNINVGERKRIKRLSFTLGKKGYYSENVVHEYLNRLDSIQYFEVKDRKGKFIALIPVSIFERSENIGLFIRSLEDSDVIAQFQSAALTETVKETVNVVEALRYMKNNDLNNVVVVTLAGKFVGVLDKRDAESSIIQNVLLAENSD